MSQQTSVQQKVNTKLWKTFQAALVKNDKTVSIKDGLESALNLYIDQDRKEQRDGKK